MLKSQNGSVATVSIVFMMVLGVILAGVLPAVTSEMRFQSMNRDSIEAQYAAEAGIKRALVEFSKVKAGTQSNMDWTWLAQKRAYINDADSKNYTVIIYEAGDFTKKPVVPILGEDKVYTIRSRGKVGKAEKVVTVDVKVKAGSGNGTGGNSHSDDPHYAANYLVYSGGSIILDGSFTQHGKIAAHGSITQHGNINADNQSKLLANQTGISWFPEFSVLTASISDSRPLNKILSNKGDVNLGGDNYNNQTIVINGDLDINNNTNFSNTALYVTGKITVNGGGVNFNNNCFVVAGGDININGSPNLGGAVYVSYSDIDMGGSGTLNSGAIYAKNDLRLHGNFTLTYGKGEIDKNLSLDGGDGTQSVEVVAGSWNVK